MYIHLVGFFILLLTIFVFFTFLVKLLTSLIFKKTFPMKMMFAALTGLILTIAIYGYNQYFFTFNHLGGEFYKGPVDSPTKKYIANAYYMTYGGAVGGVNVWVEITYNDKKNKKKIIYYSDAKSNFSMKWTNEDTLSIINEDYEIPSSNRSIELDVEKEIYHDRGLACQSLLMKKEYETCYHGK
ncbi:DUF5412 family protein [Cytobacillus sp. FJAT-53684]|uniref:DUF5412 family protein n=1 Tax=Cytobacillus mangrovibacter TaxID=3299024 RepID=A0ABW6JZS0_9BACI